MAVWKTNKIRSTFLNYFEKQGHTIVPGSSLVPYNDASLLFTNAGMVQFKDVFLGNEELPYTRVADAQPCIRAGGKHNDLDNVGYTARHHTFFEMLGNFSFGDYFKREAIQFAWNFLTQELGIPTERLWITVFREDDEAANIWLNEIGIDPKRFSRCDEADNFWSMGETGPCGPCSEIFYDHGESIPGGPPGTLEADGDRYIEIWNLVFMQYDRDSNGQLTLLPKPSVDTGMGLERIASVLQGVHSNYDTDTFQHLIQAAQDIIGVDKNLPHKRQSYNVIADHIRATVFLIADGVMPSNEHRGYVLRRIIRRALRHGHKLGMNVPFFYCLVAPLAEEMGDTYPKLREFKSKIESIIKQEEEQFLGTLAHGLKLLSEEIQQAKNKILSGEIVFRLYDTYGFPKDLTADILREHGITFDEAEFEKCMSNQKERSQKASGFASGYGERLSVEGETLFTGYENLHDQGNLVQLFREHHSVDILKEGEEGMVVLDRTPFYAESGGQVGDQGSIITQHGEFKVSDTRKQGKVYLHHGHVEKGTIQVNEMAQLRVDPARKAVMINHSATHLLHAALRRMLGDEVTQKGSLVTASRLRFDFSYPKPLTPKQIIGIERMVNENIRSNLKGEIELTSQDIAIQKGALALFGEKYDKEVRMLSFGDVSKELCGGTHVHHTGEIGLFKIISETGIASGVRRIEAVTGEEALSLFIDLDAQLANMALQLKTSKSDVLPKFQQVLEANQKLTKSLEQIRQKLAKDQVQMLESLFEKHHGVDVLSRKIENMDPKSLKLMVDGLKQKREKAVMVLTTVLDDRIHVVAGVTSSSLPQLKADELVTYIAQQIGGQGGGRADLAQGSGHLTSSLETALASVSDWVDQKLCP